MAKKKNGNGTTQSAPVDIDAILNASKVDVPEAKKTKKDAQPTIVLSKEESEDLKTFVSEKLKMKEAKGLKSRRNIKAGDDTDKPTYDCPNCHCKRYSRCNCMRGEKGEQVLPQA